MQAAVISRDSGLRRNNQTIGRARRGGASLQNITGTGNWLAPGFAARLGQTGMDASRNTIAERSLQLYVDPSRHDYGLREAWPGIVGAGRPLNRLQLPGTPGAAGAAPPLRWQYEYPLDGNPRSDVEHPDLGAHEFSRP